MSTLFVDPEAPATTTAGPAIPEVAQTPCRHYSSAALRWAAHPELEPYMRATYEAHVAASCRRRAFVEALPGAALGDVAQGGQLRREAVPELRRMLGDARSALATAQNAGDPAARALVSFGVTSAYRSALQQYRLWNRRFPRYFAQTMRERSGLSGGPTGEPAARWLAHWIGTWLAAPGFSNHNDGRAVDLGCRLSSGKRLSADRADIPAWGRTWLHGWLTEHAAAYGFVPYHAEPWHWEYRPAQVGVIRNHEVAASPAPGPSVASARPADYWRAQLRYGLAGNSVRPLVDGKAALKAIKEAIETASGPGHFVYLLGWWVDPWVHLAGPDTCLLNLFARAGQRGVQIRVLMWDSPSLIYPGHSKLHDAAVTALNKIPHCYAQQDAGGGLTSTKAHHQKLVVVQGSRGLIALCGGVDVNADRLWDKLPPPASAYRPDRPNVGWNGASGSGSGPKGEEGIPFHDVHSRLSGPTALPLLRVFLRRWWARSGDRDIDRRDPLRGTFNHPVPPVTGHDFVRVGETFDGVLRSGDGRAVASRKVTVQDIWLRSILGARRFIYIEDQYLISDCAARAIRMVMARTSLKHVTILIPPSEITDLSGVWKRRQAFIDRIVSGNPHADKLHVYTRGRVTAAACARKGYPHLYVHAKMAVIDDELMLIGSANCNNRGWETDSELVVATFQDASGQASVAGRLRAQLWAHHLGVGQGTVLDPLASRQLWDAAPSRHVCPYDPKGGSDPWSDYKPDMIIDPSDRRPGDPCETLLRAPGVI
jgi:phosphatidylserine/phosphatidylglycerophosphate/cardiolipin synthase-like enzyme